MQLSAEGSASRINSFFNFLVESLPPDALGWLCPETHPVLASGSGCVFSWASSSLLAGLVDGAITF